MIKDLQNKAKENDKYKVALVHWKEILVYITVILKFFCCICLQRNETSRLRVENIGLDINLIEEVIRANDIHDDIKT